MTKSVLIIAHRGYSSKYPECTPLAYEEAIKAGVDFIEIDIRRSRDGFPVVFHARDLSEVSDRRGKIKDYTLKELKQVEITAEFGNRYGFQPIPTLVEILTLAAKGGVRVCAEMKDLEDQDIPGYEELVVPTFLEQGLKGRFIFNTKNYSFLQACHKKYPFIPLAVDLMVEKDLADLDRYIDKLLSMGVQIVQYDLRVMKAEVVKELKCRGLSVWAWTINTTEEMNRVIGWGVDAVLTDNPVALQNQPARIQ